jgi:lipopolysaccharide export system permease protein
MRIFTRHILLELNKVFVVALIGLTMLLLIVGVVKEGTAEHLPMADLLRLIPYILPDSLRVTLPVTLLLAATTVYARLSGFNEVVALKALGVSPMAILWPSYAMAFLLSLATVYMNDVAVSWGRSGVQRVITEAVENIAYNMLRTQRFYSTPKFAMYVKQVEGRRLIGVRLSVQAQGDNPAMMITAEEAELRSDPERNALRILLREGTVSYQGRMSYQFHDTEEQEVPLRDERDEADANLPSSLKLSVIPGQIDHQLTTIRNYSQEMAVRGAFEMLAPGYGDLNNPDWDRRYEVLTWMNAHLCRLLTEPHRRWATGFSCLFFIWVGAPMAIRLRNSDLLTSFFLCFLPILVVYYPLMVYGVNGAKNGTVPCWTVWTGNVLLAMWGLGLLRKVLRY